MKNHLKLKIETQKNNNFRIQDNNFNVIIYDIPTKELAENIITALNKFHLEGLEKGMMELFTEVITNM